MKVTFTCPTCDFVYECTVADDKWSGTFMTVPVPPHICPRAKLSYGPLTEEMVAEALEEVGDSYRDEARFVLRLLNEVNQGGGVPLGGFPVGDYLRDWLLKLAREP